jgi:TolB protein
MYTIKRVSIATFSLYFFMNSMLSQQSQTGVFDGHSDVGNVSLPGSVVYNPDQQEYWIEGSGKNIWFDRDEFHLLWEKISGDFILTCSVEFIGKGTEAHRKIGWMVRNSLDTGSSHVSAVIHGDGLTSLQYRKNTGGMTEEMRSPVTGPTVVRLERAGNSYSMSVAKWGEPFVKTQALEVSLNDEVYAGLFVCSHNDSVSEKAVFRNVRITLPATPGFIPYQDYIGSNLEILDVKSGLGKILYHTADAIQAPNWTADGRCIVYNSKGLLYLYKLENNAITKINTGFATNNNNDHVISFDGKLLGISHHSVADSNNSIIYTLPLKGSSKPKRITATGPSYLHGWSPDGKNLLFTGSRNNKYDIYSVSVNTKKETQLTDAEGLDDGSEYTPDGKYIYFNSNRTGRMQIWRMKPDGSEQEQVTSDRFNDWFPHISPDGKWIVFLSYGLEVAPGDHPYYKPVYLRLMPVAGGKPVIIAYVYGGQGTLNVPSWSPDNKRIAFISNTK